MAADGRLLPALAAALASVFWGATVVAVRYVLPQTDPLTVAVFRHGIGTLLILPVLLVVGAARIPLRDLLPIGALGIAMFGLFSICSAAGLRTIYAARGALILTTMPLLTLLLASLFHQERFTLQKLGGIVLTVLGVGVALGSESWLGQSADASSWRGDLFMFAAALLGAVYNAFSPRYLKRYPALPVTVYSMLAGTLFLLAIAEPAGVVDRFHGFTPQGWLAIGFIGAFGAAASFFLWVWALERTTPSRVVVFFGLNPLSATLLAALLLGEHVTVWFLLGLCCVLSGIWLVNYGRDATAPRRVIAPSVLRAR